MHTYPYIGYIYNQTYQLSGNLNVHFERSWALVAIIARGYQVYCMIDKNVYKQNKIRLDIMHCYKSNPIPELSLMCITKNPLFT